MTIPFLTKITSLSFNQIKRDLKIWATSLPDYDQYKLFYEDEAGDIIFDLIAGFEAYCSYNDIVSTQENFLNYCLNRNSAIGITSSYAYNSFRGINHHIQLRINPTKDQQIIKLTPIGLVNGISLSTVNDYTFIANNPITIECVIGEIETLSLLAPNSRLYIFRFAEPGISFDIKLQLNGTEIPFSTSIKDMLKDYWYVQSNAYGGVDAYYLNESLISPIYPYNTGDILTLTYIKHGNLIYNFPMDIRLFDATLDDAHPDTKELTSYKNAESLESIKINGPLHNETGDTIKAREDYPKLFKILNAEFTDTNSRDVSLPVIYLSQKRDIPAFLDITYALKSKKILSNNEKNIYKQKLTEAGARAHNIPPTEIIDPKHVKFNIRIELTKKNGANNSTYLADVKDILSYYYDARDIKRLREDAFGYIFSIKELEYDLERLPYVLIARVSINKTVWNSNTNVKRGEFILPTVDNGFMYEVITNTFSINIPNLTNDNIGINTGLTEPTWGLTSGKYVFEDIPIWQASNSYTVGQYVQPTTQTGFVYKCVQAGTSNGLEPVWNLIQNSLNTDNTVIWMAVNPYEVTGHLIYKTIPLTQINFNLDWNETFIFDYGTSITWL